MKFRPKLTQNTKCALWSPVHLEKGSQARFVNVLLGQDIRCLVVSFRYKCVTTDRVSIVTACENCEKHLFLSLSIQKLKYSKCDFSSFKKA